MEKSINSIYFVSNCHFKDLSFAVYRPVLSLYSSGHIQIAFLAGLMEIGHQFIPSDYGLDYVDRYNIRIKMPISLDTAPTFNGFILGPCLAFVEIHSENPLLSTSQMRTQKKTNSLKGGWLCDKSIQRQCQNSLIIIYYRLIVIILIGFGINIFWS